MQGLMILSKETVQDKLVTKVNIIDTQMPSTSGLATETQQYFGKARY